jgi:hypothetical protein
VTAPNVHLSERTSVVKQFESVPSWGLAIAVLWLTSGVAEPAWAEEAAHGSGKPNVEASAFHVAPDSQRAIVPGVPGRLNTDLPSGEVGKTGRTALDQPDCAICLGGSASVTWIGNSGSFHVDRIANYRSSGTSGQLDLKVVLSSSLPVFHQTVTTRDFSSSKQFSPLQAGYQYAPADSGTISFFGSSIPVGEYWLLLFLRENSGGTWFYTDWTLMDKKVSCNGSGCSTVSPPSSSSCVEDAYTMCLLSGRYKVTSRWKNQYGGGAEATLQKARLTDVTGAFWIADANTYEYMIRVNTVTDNGRAWMTILTFTSVEFWMDVTDTKSGQFKQYHSEPGNVTLIYDPTSFVYP